MSADEDGIYNRLVGVTQNSIPTSKESRPVRQIDISYRQPVLEYLNNLWGLKPSRNRVVVLARQGSYAGGIDSLEPTLGLPKSSKVWAQATLAGGIDSLESMESIPGLLKRSQIRAQVYATVYSLFLDTTWMGRSNTTCLLRFLNFLQEQDSYTVHHDGIITA